MKKTLYSLHPDQYPDMEKEFTETTAEGTRQYTTGQVILARKTAVVQARVLTEETVVDTRPRVRVDGREYTFIETLNTAPAGSIVITNPDGEDYVLKDQWKTLKIDGVVQYDENGQEKKYLVTAQEQFAAKYQAVEGGFVAIEGPKHFEVTTQDICFAASWGEMQFAPAGSYICTEYGPGEEYSVTNSAFEATYEPEVSTMDD